MPTMFFRPLLTLVVLLSAPALTLQAAVIITSGPSASNAVSASSFSITGVAAQAGDYIVVSAASNKNTTNAPLSATWTGSGSVSSLSEVQTAAAYLFYVAVTADGTYDLTVTSSNQTFTANYASYVLRAGVGEKLSLLDTATFSSASAASADLTYTYGDSLLAGSAVAIESFSGAAFTRDSDYSQAYNGGTGARVGTYSTSVSGLNWTSTNALSTPPGAIAAVGGLFVASSVPEPARATLVLIGMMSILSRRRRS